MFQVASLKGEVFKVLSEYLTRLIAYRIDSEYVCFLRPLAWDWEGGRCWAWAQVGVDEFEKCSHFSAPRSQGPWRSQGTLEGEIKLLVLELLEEGGGEDE